jgi:hypothetical protein
MRPGLYRPRSRPSQGALPRGRLMIILVRELVQVICRADILLEPLCQYAVVKSKV